MSNQDTPTPPSPTLMTYLMQLFNPATLAALRYALAALSPVLAIFGFAALTPDQIDHFISYAKTFGTAAAAVSALVGIVLPVVIAIIGVLASTVKKQIARVRELANNPQLANAEAAKALTEATSQLAKSGDVQKSADAVNALVKATIGLDQVQTIVASGDVAGAALNASVVSSERHEVVPTSSS